MKKKYLAIISAVLIASFLFGVVYGQTVTNVVLHVVGNSSFEGGDIYNNGKYYSWNGSAWIEQVGPEGPQGPSGINGTNGADGSPGANGTNGTNGTNALQPIGAYSFLIGVWANGTYYAQNGTDGTISFSSTNATTIIQNTINALTPARTWQETINLRGNFGNISGNITMANYTRIIGSGAVLTMASGGKNIFMQGNNFLTDITIEGITFDSAQLYNGRAIYFANYVSAGIYMAHNITIRDNTFKNLEYGFEGIFHTSNIINNKFINCSQGINIEAAFDSSITDNYFLVPKASYGCYIIDAYHMSVVGNHFLGDWGAWDCTGLILDGEVSTTTITGNTFDSISGDAIIIGFQADRPQCWGITITANAFHTIGYGGYGHSSILSIPNYSYNIVYEGNVQTNCRNTFYFASSNQTITTETINVPTQGEVLYMPFEEGTGTAIHDWTQNSNTGTLTAGSGAWIDGVIGKGYSCSGSSIAVADSASLNLTQMSISFWVKPSTVSGIHDIIFKGADEPRNYRIRLNGVAIDFDYTDVNSARNIWSSENFLSANSLYFISITFQAGAITVRSNNTLLLGSWGTGTGTAAPKLNAEPVNIGSAIIDYYSGTLDELRIYNRILSPMEEVQLYLNGLSGIQELSGTYNAQSWR